MYGDYMSPLNYTNRVLEILSESPALKKSASGVLKQTGYAAGGAAIGGIFGGPAGALVGTVIGGILGYSAVDPYDSLITSLNQLSDREKVRLAPQVQKLVGNAFMYEFIEFIKVEKNRRLLLDLLQTFVNSKSSY